jgi:PAS domain S-box-containing protein
MGFDIHKIQTLVHPDDLSNYEASLQAALANNGVFIWEGKLLHENGSWVSVRMQSQPGEEKQHLVTREGIMVPLHNARGKRSADKKDTLLRVLLENAADPIVALDTDYNIQLANPAFQRIAGAEIAEGISFLSLFPEQEAAQKKTAITRVLQKGNTLVEEEVVKVKDELVIFEVTYTPLVQNGKTSGVSIFYKNITDLKVDNEEHKRKAQSELEQSLLDFVKAKNAKQQEEE